MKTDTEGSQGQQRGRTRTPVRWGPGLDDAEQGDLVGFGVWPALAQGEVRFKSFGANPRNQGKTVGSPVPGEGKPGEAAAVSLQAPQI